VTSNSARSTALLGGIPSYRKILMYALPLSLAGLAMNLEQPIISGGISRLSQPELGLAAFGVVMSIGFWIEAPIIMLIDLATALGTDRVSFGVIRRYAMLWCGLVVAMMALVGWTPVGTVMLRSILGVDAEIATRAHEALKILIIWPAMVGWRRVHQGVLIRTGHTRVIGYFVGLRLTGTTTSVVVGTLTAAFAGPILGVVAMNIGLGIETLSTFLYTQRVIRQDLAPLPEDGAPPVNFKLLNHYFLPLVGSALCYNLVSPIVSAGLARSAAPATSLAVWPVAYNLVQTTGSPLNGFQQVAIRLAARGPAVRKTRRFTLGAGVALSAFLMISNLTGLTSIILRDVLGLPPSLDHPGQIACWILTVLPAVVAMRSLCRGVLIHRGTTKPVQAASALNFAIVMIGMLVIGSQIGLPGYELAAFTVLSASFAEAGILALRSLRGLSSSESDDTVVDAIAPAR